MGNIQKRKTKPQEEVYTPEEVEKIISDGGKTTLESKTEAPSKPEKVPKIGIQFDIPVKINKMIEDDRNSRIRKISKTQWILDAILKKLRVKDK